MKIVMLLVGLLALLVTPSKLSAAEEEPSQLTVERIYDSDEFEPDSFSAIWLKDSSGYLTLESLQAIQPGKAIVAWSPKSSQQDVLVPSAHLIPPGRMRPLSIDGYTFSKDRSLVLIYTNAKRVWRRKTRGDYWVLDRASRELIQVGGSDVRPSSLMFAKFSPDGRYVIYVSNNNLFRQDLRDGGIVALTNSKSPKIINGTFDWVYEEEFGLRDGFRISPDGRFVAYWHLDSTGVREFPLINNTDSLYPEIRQIPYPKVGQRNSACTVKVVDLHTGETTPLSIPGDPREHYIARISWIPLKHDPQAEAGQQPPPRLLLQRLNRRQNTLQILLADPENGAVRLLLTEKDQAWVDVHDELKFHPDGQRFTWISERDGWRHVYLVSLQDGSVTLATPGNFDVVQLLCMDQQGSWLYFIAAPGNPTERFLYRVRIDGTSLQRLTPQESTGTHRYQISPDAKWAIHRHSTFETPGPVELISLPDHRRIRMLAKNQRIRRALRSLRRGPSEFFRVDIGGDVLLDGWCIKPPDFDPDKTYPLLIYVYGEPAGTTVVNRWGGKNYLWHTMLAQHGYVVMSFDNRGTRAPRGREWRKAVHHQIGILAPQDQAAALEAVLRDRPFIDPKRVGIWGWSGGGSMSLNAIFKYPELYHTAMAVAPVANQRYYDTIYQERYMGLPGDNPEGFLKGSPINYAHQLTGNLLLVHGTGDDNCHYQATEALINELVRHHKPFTMMAYPNRSHSVSEGSGTTRHLRELLARYLTEKMPPSKMHPGGGKPSKTTPANGNSSKPSSSG